MDIQEIDALIATLTPYANSGDFSLHSAFIKAACQQIIKDGKVKLPRGGGNVAKLVKDHADGSADLGKILCDAHHAAPFAWPLYERCAAFCREQGCYAGDFANLPDKPQKPQTLAATAILLKVADLKALLKAAGHKPATTKGALTEQAENLLTLADFDPVIMPWLATARAKYENDLIYEKYAALARMVLHRAYFLRQIARPNPLFYPVLAESSVPEEDRRLATWLDGDGYAGVVQGEKIAKLLPLFPGDMMDIYFKVRPARAAVLT